MSRLSDHLQIQQEKKFKGMKSVRNLYTECRRKPSGLCRAVRFHSSGAWSALFEIARSCASNLVISS